MDDLQPPRARYRQVADRLRQAIQAGEYAPGELLPSQPELARRYGLNQTSINRAIALLRQEGLVRVEQGRGAYVLDLPTARRVRRIPHRDGERVSTFASEMHRLGLEPKTDLVGAVVTSVPGPVAQLLGVEGDQQVLVGDGSIRLSTDPDRRGSVPRVATISTPLVSGRKKVALSLVAICCTKNTGHFFLRNSFSRSTAFAAAASMPISCIRPPGK